MQTADSDSIILMQKIRGVLAEEHVPDEALPAVALLFLAYCLKQGQIAERDAPALSQKIAAESCRIAYRNPTSLN